MDEEAFGKSSEVSALSRLLAKAHVIHGIIESWRRNVCQTLDTLVCAFSGRDYYVMNHHSVSSLLFFLFIFVSFKFYFILRLSKSSTQFMRAGAVLWQSLKFSAPKTIQ